ncbi:hypothetical protein [Luteolibacter sp. LG18]|uniref:hypothetical protein n=1 Tax=Luteolibacter sp. LG18 TaxID=2819286 RepID=UPI002B2F4733|nr:hypothetical protein llg_14530 [Luteolibacter sp. LG18]
MKTLLLPLAVASTLLLSAHAQEAPLPAPELAGWGAPTDPDGDCKISVVEDALQMEVPGGKAHDLAAEIDTTNAPRVLQAVNGDFTLQVKVDGKFSPGEESTKASRTGYNGAAIIAMMNADNVVTLARAVLHNGSEEVPYANFEIRSEGKLLRMGSTGDQELPKDGPVYLRLERRGDKFLAATSSDGTTWKTLTPKDVPGDWSQELQVGLAAISTSKEPFTPRFSKLQLLK